jgi:predicted GH43/DUF377 family glycosyl hydrolase
MKSLRVLLASIVVFVLLAVVAVPAFASGGFVKAPTNPVVTGVSGWESGGVQSPSVILDGFIYKMWYSGTDANGFTRIGYATSTDSVTWSKYAGNPVLDVTASAWDSNIVGAPSVIKDGGTYKMWYTGANAGVIGRIGYATSPDGITWTKSLSNPVLNVGGAGSWDEIGVLTPSVVKEGSMYKMWYTGRQNDSSTLGLLSIGYATSSDGINWTPYGSNPIMTKNVSGFDNRGVGGTSVIGAMGGYTMYYAGFENGSLLSEIGMAASTDGINWARQAASVLQVGSPTSWEEKGVGDPAVLLTGGITQMWYTGTTNNYLTEIGYASQAAASVPAPPSTVPASSNTGALVMIGGFALMIGLVLFGRGRLQQQR